MASTLLKPKHHSLRCHCFMVHAYNHCACASMLYISELCELAKTVPSRMKLTMKLTMREPASMATDTWSRRVTSDFNSVFQTNHHTSFQGTWRTKYLWNKTPSLYEIILRVYQSKTSENQLVHFKVAATSLKLEVRLYTLTILARTHDLVPKYFLRSSDWLMRSELGYFARIVLFQA